MSGIARERCCCGATFEISAYLTSTVEKGIQQFRDDHAGCRQTWAYANAPAVTSPRTVLLENVAEHARVVANRVNGGGVNTEPWHGFVLQMRDLARALDNLDRTETP